MGRDDILNVREIADLVRLSPQRVRQLLASGGLPGFRLPGGQWRARRSRLEECIARLEERAA
jgi:excisionase family DNA binding protein